MIYIFQVNFICAFIILRETGKTQRYLMTHRVNEGYVEAHIQDFPPQLYDHYLNSLGRYAILIVFKV